MRNAHFRLYLVAFLMDCALACGFTATPFYCFDELGGGARMAGVIFALQFAAYSAASLITSRFVAGTKRGLTWALAGATVFSTFYALSATLASPLFFAGMTVVAMGCFSMIWAALQSWLGSEPDPWIRARRVAVFTLSWSGGIALGPVIAGPLYDWNHRMPFGLVFLLGSVGAGLICTLPREHEVLGRLSGPPNEAHAAHDRKSEGFLYCAWAANAIGCFLMFATRAIFPKRIAELVAAGELVTWFESGGATQFGALAFVLSVSRAVTFFALGRTSRWQHRFGLLAMLQLTAGVAMSLLAHTRSLSLMGLCCLFIGANNGLTFFSSSYYSLANPIHKHARAAIHESMVGLGNSVGPLVFGLLAGAFGVAWPFQYAPVFIVAGLGLQWALVVYGRRANGAPWRTAQL